MKIVIGTLLFTFLVFFNPGELSSQSNIPTGNGSYNPYGIHQMRLPGLQEDIRLINAPNIPNGTGYLLPNGKVYISLGTGRIQIFYNTRNEKAIVHQEGAPAVYLPPSPFRVRHPDPPMLPQRPRSPPNG